MPSRNIVYAGKDVPGPAESAVTAEPPAAAWGSTPRTQQK